MNIYSQIDCCPGMAVPDLPIDESRNRVSATAHPGDPVLVDILGYGSETAAGERVTETTALKFSAILAAVKVLAETIASLPFGVYHRLPGGGKEPSHDHPLHYLLHDAPNGEMDAYLFREAMQAHLGTHGNAYAEIERSRGGKVLALWPCAPDRVRTKRVGSGADRRIVHEYTRPSGGVEKIPAADMLHIAGLGYDGIVGYSPIRLMAEPIGLGMAAERFAAEVFSNNAAPAGVLEHPGVMSDKAQDRLNVSLKRRAAHGKRHKTLVLEEGMKWATLSMKPEDVQMILTRRFQLEDIARAYRIAPSLLQDLTHGTFSNITELGRQFIVYTMMPWFCRWQSATNRQLLGRGEFFAEFNQAAFLQGDPKARGEFYRSLFGVGSMTINEIRQKENMNPMGEGGDTPFVPLNMVPLDRIQEVYDAKQPPEEPAADDPPDEDQPEGGPPPDEALRELAIAAARRALRPLFLDAAGRALRRDAKVLQAAAKRHLAALDPNWADWRAAVRRHYDTAGDYFRDALLPAVQVYAAQLGPIVGGAANAETLPAGVDAAIRGKLDEFTATSAGINERALCDGEKVADAQAVLDAWAGEAEAGARVDHLFSSMHLPLLRAWAAVPPAEESTKPEPDPKPEEE